jgi:hypothetical protein
MEPEKLRGFGGPVEQTGPKALDELTPGHVAESLNRLPHPWEPALL